MSNIYINKFLGLQTLYDQRSILPNQPGEPAESPDCENVEITAQGALVTSNGFELVSEITATGGVNMLMTYEKDATTKQLIIGQDDDYYYITPANTAWQTIGDYGTAATNVGGTIYKGTSSIRRAILGNDTAANDTKLWDGTTFSTLGGSPPDGYIMESFQGRLFSASGSTLYYTDVEDEADWAGGGVISFPDLITGLKTEGEFMQVHTKRDSFTVQFYYNDSFSLSAPLKKPFKNASGCISHKTLVSVYNDSYHLSIDGLQRFGADPNFIAATLRVNSLSWNIAPSLDQSKLSMASISKACGAFYKKKYYLAVPLESDTYNSKVFQYNWDYSCWTVRSGFFPSSLAVFPDSVGRDQLYFGSALAPQLYMFNMGWSYNGSGYTKKWKSKIFNMGTSVGMKKFDYIDIAGSIFLNTVFYVDVTVDGITVTYQIDSSNLLQSSSGGYYGDDYLGSLFYGGDTENPFKRYGARLPMPMGITEGREMQITIRNQNAGEPWSVDMINIVYDNMDPIKIPTEAQITEITT